MSATIKRYPTSSQSSASFGPELHPVIASIYAHRNVQQISDVQYSLKTLLPYHSLKGIDSAARIIASAVQAQSRVLIIGDFDADGATSVTLMVKALTEMGAEEVGYLVPNRFEYGYGLTPEIVEVAKAMSPDLIITVDNGISSLAGVAAANQAGIQVVITDHHLAGEELPQADAIVNPNQPGCEFPSKAACGCAVAFYVMCAVRQTLRDASWFDQRVLPNMASYLDLLALATVADVVPLDKNNRTFVSLGLQRIRSGQCLPGIRALLQVAGKQANQLTASDLGFAIGPRLNAAGRLDDMAAGIECLLASSDTLALSMAQQLDELNADRKVIEQDMQQQAMQQLSQIQLQNDEDNAQEQFGMCLYQPDWHQGVIGILASRIKDKYHRPVIVFAKANPDDPKCQDLKGSARSIKGLHIRDALDLLAKRFPKLLTKFGGHAMAAGMSIHEEHFVEFSEAFNHICEELMAEDALQHVIMSDGEIIASEMTMPLAQIIRDAGPWGQSFPEPVFDGEFKLMNQRIVGSKHLKLVLSPLGLNQNVSLLGVQMIDAIAFNVDVEQWPDNNVQSIRCAYQLDINEFRGRQSLQLLIRHIEKI